MAENKKRKTKNNNAKINAWKISNLVLIMITVVLLAVMIEVVSIAALAANAYKGEEVYELTVDIVKNTNFSMNKVVFVTMGIFALAHIINYVLYVLKQRSFLIIANIVEIVFAILCMRDIVGLIILLPMLSGLIYLRILRLEEK